MEAAEASLCYFFKNWLMKLKCPNSEMHVYLHFDQKVVFSWPPRPSKYIKSGRKTLYISLFLN